MVSATDTMVITNIKPASLVRKVFCFKIKRNSISNQFNIMLNIQIIASLIFHMLFMVVIADTVLVPTSLNK